MLRLLRDPGGRAALEREAAAMRAAAAAGVPVPEPGEIVEHDGRPGLLLERVEGRDLLAGLGSRPWALPDVARALGELQARLHEVAAPPGVPRMADVAREVVERAGDALPGELAQRALDRLATLPDGDRLLHGDLHPGNLLGDLSRPVAIDWSRAMAGHPSADVAHSRLLIRIARLHPSSPALLKALHPLGRGLMERIHLRSYRRLRRVDDDLLDAWQPVLAAARLGLIDDPGEREVLLELAR